MGACLIQWTLVFIELVWRSGPHSIKCYMEVADADDITGRNQLSVG
jgi:hypothetical protein